jgi:De-etiolated protein 1 Det1
LPQVSLPGGACCDSFTLRNDFVRLREAHGVRLYEDLLLLLGLCSQQLFLLQVGALTRGTTHQNVSLAGVRGP